MSGVTTSHRNSRSAKAGTRTLLWLNMAVPFSFGGTGLLIVVGVSLDTVQQIESYLISRNYEGFTGPKGPRIRGRGAGNRQRG